MTHTQHTHTHNTHNTHKHINICTKYTHTNTTGIPSSFGNLQVLRDLHIHNNNNNNMNVILTEDSCEVIPDDNTANRITRVMSMFRYVCACCLRMCALCALCALCVCLCVHVSEMAARTYTHTHTHSLSLVHTHAMRLSLRICGTENTFFLTEYGK